MRRKPLSSIPPRASFPNAIALLALCATCVTADELLSTNNSPKILGANTCSSSSCHGGGGENQNQSLVWSLRDFHSQRPFATLTTARSKQIGDALQIKNPTTDNRCTSCHAPLQEVPASLRGEAFQVSEGVSCESCHGPAEHWLRAHTRPDWTRADRTAVGMRDLKNLYVRANTCVACHQTVETPLLKAGHPELIFELDGQSVSQPKHWREGTNWSGAQSWLVGQAVALREMSWQLSREKAPDERLVERWSALLWLLQQLDGVNPHFQKLRTLPASPEAQTFLFTQKASDELALRAAEMQWTEKMSGAALKRLAAAGAAFKEDQIPTSLHARRAERLVLALDRLLAAQPANAPSAANEKLNELFKRVQSLPDFDPHGFAAALDDFAGQLTAGTARR